MIEYIFIALGMVILFLTFAGLQRKFFPETIINGFMDRDKAKEISPEIFDRSKKTDDSSQKS